MADTTTGLNVKSISTESVRAKLVDTGGTNEAAISAGGRVSVDGSGVTQPVSGTVAVSSITTAVVPGTAATNLGKAQGAVYSANDVGVMSLGVRNDAGTILTGSADQDYVPLTTDATGALRVIGGSSGVQYVGDAAATSTPTGTMTVGLANAAAPTDVSANNDAVAQWFLRNGSAVNNLASGGTLITVGQKAMASSLPVVISSDQTTFPVTLATQYVGDAAATATPTGGMTVGLANAAAPSDVSANNDAVSMWMLRNGSPVVNLASGGTLVTLGSKVSASSIPVVIASDQGAVAVSGTVSVTGVSTAANQTNVQVVDNAAFTDGTTTLLMGGYIFDDVAGTGLTENDAAAARIDTKRAQVFVGEDATTRTQKWAISAAGALAGNITQLGGATIGATAFLPARLTDGTAYYANTGQTAGTSVFSRINDGTTTAGVIVGTTALKTDASSIAGAVPSATNPLPVRLTDGAAFYAAGSGAPTLPVFSTKTSSALGAGSSVDLTHYVTSGKTGQLMGVDVASTVAMKVIINTEVTASKTTRVVLFTLAGQPILWRSPYKTFITRASADATSGFSVTITNKDASVAADVYSTAFWDEV